MSPRRRTREETAPVEGDQGGSRGLAGTLKQFFMRLSTSFGSRIDYNKAYKNGARAEEHMDAHN